ncbi:MAG: glycosyltransferase family 4 protein [Armatimonadetes bacterium]|nr:glycosyltransferase family 4 protein [Armatimonadota bacterium]
MARHVISLLSGLDEDGYQVAVACEPDGPIARAAQERPIPVFDMPISPRSGTPQAARAAVRVARVISDLKVQIVHTHSFRAGLIGALSLPLAGTGRLVATLHNYPPGADGMRTRRRGERWALGLLCRSACRLITVCDALRRDLLALRPELAAKTVVIPNGIDTQAPPPRDPAETRSALGIPDGAPLVGMVARLAPQKGVADFMRAARVVADGAPSARFVVVGDGPLRDEAQALCQELKLEACVRFLGEMESARDVVAALDLLVLPSISEGSPILAMEAMALGKPVVATAVGGVPEIVVDGQTGILVEPRDPEALGQAALSLLREAERAREMGEQGRQRAALHFDVREMLERTKVVYADLLREELEARGGER